MQIDGQLVVHMPLVDLPPEPSALGGAGSTAAAAAARSGPSTPRASARTSHGARWWDDGGGGGHAALTSDLTIGSAGDGDDTDGDAGPVVVPAGPPSLSSGCFVGSSWQHVLPSAADSQHRRDSHDSGTATAAAATSAPPQAMPSTTGDGTAAAAAAGVAAAQLSAGAGYEAALQRRGGLFPMLFDLWLDGSTEAMMDAETLRNVAPAMGGVRSLVTGFDLRLGRR